VSYIQLQTRTLFCADDGAIHILLPQGGSLRFGVSLAPFLDELARGIPELEWSRRINTDPLAAQVNSALSEHHLLEQTGRLQNAPPIRPLAASGINATTWWFHVLALPTTAATTIYYCVSVLMATAKPFPWQGWLLIPVALTFSFLFHETGHYSVARLCKCSAVIKIWKNGSFRPRCAVKPGKHPLSTQQKALILAAGPWSDCLLLLSTTTCLSFLHGHFTLRIFSACALFFLLSNLWPSRQSDFFKILSLAPGQPPRLWVIRVFKTLLTLTATACLIAIIRSFGFFPNDLL